MKLTDVLDAHDKKRNRANMASGEIVQGGATTALVRLDGSSAPQVADVSSGSSVSAGNRCVLIRPTPNSRWVILSEVSSVGTGRQVSSTPSESFQLSPPANFRALVNTVIGSIVIAWDAPAQQPVVFEVQASSSESEDNLIDTLTTRGSYFIIESDERLYFRARAISSSFNYSRWTDWVIGYPGQGLSKSFGVAEVTITPDSPLYEVIHYAKNGTHVKQCVVNVVEAFDGNATITVGEQGAPSRHMEATENNLQAVGTYETNPHYTYLGDDEIRVYFSGSPTVGRAIVYIYY